MFRKRANLRGGKKGDDDDDDAPGVLSAPSAKAGTDASDKKAKKPAAKAALLSFEDEETDAEVFQVKKVKMKKKSMRAPDARGDVAVVQTSSAGRGVFITGASRAPRGAEKLGCATVGAPGPRRAGDYDAGHGEGEWVHWTYTARLRGIPCATSLRRRRP